MVVFGDERAARAALGWLTEPGNRHIHQLVAAHGAAATAAMLSAGQVPFMVRAGLRSRPLPVLWAQARAVLAEVERAGGRVLIPSDPDWPAGLAEVGWQPVCLWARGPGRMPQPAQSVTVVGTRAATAYGLQVAADLATGLVVRRWTVVSTPALGVDAAAVRAAVTVDPGRVVAVLPYGLDQVQPAGHRPLLERIGRDGLLLSVWPAGARPTRDRWAANLAVVAALTAGTVVVEASWRSRAVEAARHAVGFGRVGMAVPGPVTSAASTGCHDLLRADSRVRPVTSAADVVADVAAGRAGFAVAEPGGRGRR